MSSCQIFLFLQEKGDICDSFLPCSTTEFSPQLRDILFMSIINLLVSTSKQFRMESSWTPARPYASHRIARIFSLTNQAK
jgi:hypothetical protein